MRPLQLIFALLLGILCTGPVIWAPTLRAQPATTAIGQWRSHLPYQGTTQIEVAGNIVYASTPVSFYSYDTEDNSLRTLSKIDGFSDNGITVLRYNKALEILFIGYENGNIDLVKGNRIVNISDILRSPNLRGSRRINHVHFHQDFAYLSCGFGLIVLDLKRNEIRASYLNIGPGAQQIQVLSSTVLNDSIYITTPGQVRAGLLRDNLNDFSRWRVYDTSNGLPNFTQAQVITLNNKLYFAAGSYPLVVFNGSGWVNTPVNISGDLRSLRTYNNKLAIVSGASVYTIDQQLAIQDLTPYSLLSRSPFSVALSPDNTAWIGDFHYGIIKNSNNNLETFKPDGPLTLELRSLKVIQEKLHVMTGGYNLTYTQRNNINGYYTLSEDGWKVFSYDTGTLPVYIQDPTNIVQNPANNNIYISSHGYGILEITPEGEHTVYNETIPVSRNMVNSIPNAEPYMPFVRITGLAVDLNNNVWASNMSETNQAKRLHKISPEGEWTSFDFSPSFEMPGRGPLKITVDNNNFKWVQLADRSGILVFDDATGDRIRLTSGAGRGNLPDDGVNTIAVDQRGEVWVGTLNGLTVFYNPHLIFDPQYRDGVVPWFRIPGDNRLTPLLENEIITSITIDAANRKWIGTQTNGLYLLSADGSEQVHHFTIRNSPLPSNRIIDLAINGASGEVFIGTDRGLMSYRGSATTPDEQFTQVKVFPNPVRPEYTGTVAISGLSANAWVKITDVAGKLVYETRATGGTVAWNGRDYNGRRPSSGVYLVFSANEDGTEGYVGKIAIIE
jgi:hypothetical protein